MPNEEIQETTTKIEENKKSSSKLYKIWTIIRKDFMSIFYTILAVAIFLSIWELLGYLEVLKQPQFYRPSFIFMKMFEQFAIGEIFIFILSSLTRLFISFIIAAIFGLIIGLLMGYSKAISSFLNPIISFLLPIPGIAWAPLVFVWIGVEPIFSRWDWINSSSWWWDFGLGNPILITIGIIAGIFPVIQNISIATKATDKKLIWAAEIMGASKFQIFRKVLIPNSLPFLFTGLKLGLARSWRTIIATELFAAAASGLGFFIFESSTLGTDETRPLIYVGIFLLSIIFFTIELVIKIIERVTIERWGMVRKMGGSL